MTDNNVCITVNYVNIYSVYVFEKYIPVLVLLVVSVERCTLVFFNHVGLAYILAAGIGTCIGSVKCFSITLCA